MQALLRRALYNTHTLIHNTISFDKMMRASHGIRRFRIGSRILVAAVATRVAKAAMVVVHRPMQIQLVQQQQPLNRQSMLSKQIG